MRTVLIIAWLQFHAYCRFKLITVIATVSWYSTAHCFGGTQHLVSQRVRDFDLLAAKLDLTQQNPNKMCPSYFAAVCLLKTRTSIHISSFKSYMELLQTDLIYMFGDMTVIKFQTFLGKPPHSNRYFMAPSIAPTSPLCPNAVMAFSTHLARCPSLLNGVIYHNLPTTVRSVCQTGLDFPPQYHRQSLVITFVTVGIKD